MIRDSSRRTVLPRWLFLTAEDRGIDTRATVSALPRGVGVVYRDYGNPGRRMRARELARQCRQHARLLLIGVSSFPSLHVPAAGVHVPRWGRWPPRNPGIVTLSVHGSMDLRRARASGADLFIIAPAFATATHPEARPLGPLRFGLLARQLPGPVAALGGITPESARRLSGIRVCTLCATGWFARHHAHGESTKSRVWWRLPRKRPPVRPSAQRASRRFRTHVRLYPCSTRK